MQRITPSIRDFTVAKSRAEGRDHRYR